jgi:hypothetical protein
MLILAWLAAWETVWWAHRIYHRNTLYRQAARCAAALGRPLVVIGAPDRGTTNGPGQGDLVIDIAPSQCSNSIQADICHEIPLPDDCCVVFVSCVLEYVDDIDAALSEILRVSGGHVYMACVESWTLTAYLYPGAKRTIPMVMSA